MKHTSLHICFVILSFLTGLLFLEIHAKVIKINNLASYEYYKYNFSYSDDQGLNTLKDPSQPPAFSLSFLDQEIVEWKNKNNSVQWDEGISGKAPRFYGLGSEYPLLGWEKFFSRNRLSSFTLSFYFLPQTVMREESLLEGIEKNSLGQTLNSTGFRVLLRNGVVHWKLQNFFTSGGKKKSKTLVSRLPFQPGKWNHLVLGYDVRNARLTMVLNEEMVDFAYATADGQKSGPQYIAGFPEEVDTFGLWVMSRTKGRNPAIQESWFLGKGFTGLIDELEFYNDYISVPSRFQIDPMVESKKGNLSSYYSVYASRVFRLNKGTQINMAEIKGKNIDKTYVRLYLCQSQKFFPEHINFTDCNQIYWGKKIIGYPTAEFYQFFLVYNNLEHTFKSINSIEFSYSENDPPLPPQWVTLEQNRDGLLMEWKNTLEEIAGYRIYYRSDNFKGHKSMIQLSIEELMLLKAQREFWTYILEGLEKDNLYFFGIKSFDLHNGQIRESDFSSIKSIYYSSDFFN